MLMKSGWFTVSLIAGIFLFFNCKSGNSLRSDQAELPVVLSWNEDWEFVKSPDTSIVSDLFHSTQLGQSQWESITLPHTANVEPSVMVNTQWQGNSFYRKFFSFPESYLGKNMVVRFEGAMQIADVYLDGVKLATHEGGYLPFEVNLTSLLSANTQHCLLVRLNNEDNSSIPPGKSISTLDFNYYSGIYRNVSLVIRDNVHFVSELYPSERPLGLMTWFEHVSEDSARIMVKTDCVNESSSACMVNMVYTLTDNNGSIVAKVTSPIKNIETGGISNHQVCLSVKEPHLWSPDHPYLYFLQIQLNSDEKMVDIQTTRIGIRTFSFSSERGFEMNGNPFKIRGTNRHQEYPFVGNAISDEANYRDAYKIKMAGFNFVRLSHYPQSPSFMDACDELGLLVMNSIPGWQFFGDSVFQKNSLHDIQQLVRRDRNHPCVVLWEASLNESGMDRNYMQKAHDLVHSEMPGDDVYTCGWIDDVYDVFIPARQHAQPPYYWNKYEKNKPLLIAEYGDWEYYAQNAGFNQTAYQDLSDAERNSRQLRGDGQKRLLQQALNFQEAHNDNLRGGAVGDANWLMFDYNRGYAPDIEASGIMDIFRLPKFSYYFYQSQQQVVTDSHSPFYQPMVFIANYWNDPTLTTVKVFSNCQEVVLYLNDELINRQKPDQDNYSDKLKHPPFTFMLGRYTPGKLRAVGFIDGKETAVHEVSTPKSPVRLKLWMDESGKGPSNNDLLFLYAAIVDDAGTVIPEATHSVQFLVTGAELIGNNPAIAEAGVASAIIKIGCESNSVTISASSDGLKSDSIRWMIVK